MSTYTIIIQGKPYPLKRPRRSANGGMFDPAENVQAKQEVAMAARQSITKPIDGPVRITATFWFERPKSHYRKTIKASAPVHHTQRPDVDNLIKTVLDGLNGIAWVDDAQVVEVIGRKDWGDTAGTTVYIASIDEGITK